LVLSLVLFPLLLGAEKAHALPSFYTLSEYNSALASARSAVDSATAEVSSAQANVDASAVYYETSTATGPVNVVLNGTFDNASAWSSIGMGDNSTILNSNIARVYNGVLIGSYNYLDFILQTGTFPSPTRQVTFRYDMSNNNFNDGQRPQADQYRVEFRTYSANGTRLNYYNTNDRSNTFGWTNFTASYSLPDDAVRWDIGFRLSDSGYWNGNFAGSIDNVSLTTNATVVTPAYTTYDQNLVNILNEKKAILTAAQAALAAIPAMAINSPTNLTASVDSGTVTLNWNAPTSGLIPERYAISWTVPGNNGWGIATGNVGDANALNTSITINPQVFATSGGWNKDYTFYIRSDHDTARMCSASSNQVTLYLADPTPPVIVVEPSESSTATNPTSDTPTVTAEPTPTSTPTPTPETSTPILTPSPTPTSSPTPETTTATTPTPEPTPIPSPSPEPSPVAPTPTGPTEAEIAATTAAQAAAQQAEAARIQAETAALIAAQAAAAQAEANRIAELEAAQEAERIKAAAEAKEKADREAADIEAARIQAEIEAQEEADRIAEEVKAAEEKAEAEAKAEAERIEADRIAEEERAIAEAESEAERIAAEEEAIAEAKAKAEAEALAEEKRIAEEAEAKELEEEKAAEEAEAKAEEEEAQAKEEELNEIIEDAKDGKELTEEQKEVVVAALIEDLKPGESISAAEVQASGVSYAELPPETPIELRTSESGEVLIITAEVAANVELVQDPGALLEAVFTDPGAALAAFGSIGADMTEGEREEATDMVVATVVATGAAINAAAVAAGGAAGGSGGGGSSGGGSGSNSPGSRGGRKW
jgi:hypothetical protein